MKTSLRIMALAASAAMISACTLGQTTDDSATAASPASSSEIQYLQPLQTAPELRIRDLPVPAGFLYKPDKSMIIEYGQVTAGILAYEGAIEAGEVIGFYRREMPKFEWTLSSMIEREESRLFFQKEGRICEITIRPGAGLGRRTGIFVYYAPKE